MVDFHNKCSIISYLDRLKCPYEIDVPLSKKTWIKTGGDCALWIEPQSVSQLENLCRYLYKINSKFDLVGQTSNIFFHSTYQPQVVVSTTKINHYEIKDDIIISECGVSVVKLAKDCLSEGYAGFYGLVGLPGTVASAIVNNAGCFDCSLSSMLVSADVLMNDGSVRTINKDVFGFSHRSSVFKRKEIDGVILTIRLKIIKSANIDDELNKSKETVVYRREKQEKYNGNLGSIYAKKRRKNNWRNSLEYYVWRILSSFFALHNRRIIEKRFLLFLYGYRDLNPYVSDKNINTFIWKDSLAEEKFTRYKKFMASVYDDLSIEIEEKK